MKNQETMKTFEMFSGYGGASFALKKAGIPFKCVGYSEVDKYAIQCYEQNHPGIKNYGDCSKIIPDDLPDFDLLTGGFPCQDVSIAGNRDLSKGRTMLINDIFRVAKSKKPKYMLLENVKGLLSFNDGKLWGAIRYTLQNLGYGVAYKVLNSKHHGIPQNRERIWIVCKYGGWEFMEFMFPNEEPLNIFIKDILEDKIDNKYYLSQKVIDSIMNRNHKDFDGISPCMTCNMQKGNESAQIVHCLQQRGEDRPSIIKAREAGKSDPGGSGHLSKYDGTSYCIDGGNSQAIENDGRWRRLTPKECFRLMGFFNDEIDLKGISDSQKYRLAGNGWDINVVSKILRRMFNV